MNHIWYARPWQIATGLLITGLISAAAAWVAARDYSLEHWQDGWDD